MILPDVNYFRTQNIVSKHFGTQDCNYLLRAITAEITTTNGFYQIIACDYVPKKLHHVAMVYDGDSLKFYRNGYLMASCSASGDLITNNWITKIGNWAAGTDATCPTGYVNEVKIWNIARSQSEIKATMNSVLSSPQTTPGLLAYYSFNSLINLQGDATFDGTLHGNATINNTIPTCMYRPDSCNGILNTNFTQSLQSLKRENKNYLQWDRVLHSYDRLTIEKSYDNVIFTKLSRIKKYTSSVIDVDTKFRGTIFYRLNWLGLNNYTNYSNTVALYNNPERSNTLLYPNPATNKVFITAKKLPISVTIYDQFGSRVKELNVTNSSFSVAKLNRGLFVCKIKFKDEVLNSSLLIY
jgi:hypothetical protein